MRLEEGDTFFYQPRALKNLMQVDEMESLSPIMSCKVCYSPSSSHSFSYFTIAPTSLFLLLHSFSHFTLSLTSLFLSLTLSHITLTLTPLYSLSPHSYSLSLTSLYSLSPYSYSLSPHFTLSHLTLLSLTSLSLSLSQIDC